MRIPKILNIIYSECIRIFRRPLIWGAIIGIAIIKLVSGLSGPSVYELIFEMGIREESLLNIDHVWGRHTILSFVTYALAALPVVGSYLEDYKSGRLNIVLSRISKVQYIVMRVVMVVLIASMCMLMGNILYMLAGHYLLGLPYAREGDNPVLSSLLTEGRVFLFWFVTEIQNCMQASFYALISLGVSFYIRDSQFITVLPMILRYFFDCFWNEYTMTWLPKWLSPRAIYIYAAGLNDDIIQCVYSVAFTACIAVSIAWLMYIRLRKEL